MIVSTKTVIGTVMTAPLTTNSRMESAASETRSSMTQTTMTAKNVCSFTNALRKSRSTKTKKRKHSSKTTRLKGKQ